jgi:hypothetical protein
MIMDLLPPEFHDKVLAGSESATTSVSEPIYSGALTMPVHIRECLAWMAEKMMTEPDLEMLILGLCEKMGWENPKTHTKKKISY